ncbi:hypothetical protein CLV37_104145 [Kineococcus rhizosphaerae]|uniref:Uncharacterized protein n=1 Tax=Kineococcus rhizosphaerae TaxID=559628 RepID=A0A2T0R581_9ACTN|nr:hypothetical protein CLV37_104145 [Kineococcus rhizosphaerae]
MLTLALAAGAAVLLGAADAVGFRSDRAESLSTPAWLLGWVLLVWAVLVGVVSAAHLGHRLLTGPDRPSAGAGVRSLLLLAGAAVVTAEVSTHPLWGNGSGAG